MQEDQTYSPIMEKKKYINIHSSFKNDKNNIEYIIDDDEEPSII